MGCRSAEPRRRQRSDQSGEWLATEDQPCQPGAPVSAPATQPGRWTEQYRQPLAETWRSVGLGPAQLTSRASQAPVTPAGVQLEGSLDERVHCRHVLLPAPCHGQRRQWQGCERTTPKANCCMVTVKGQICEGTEEPQQWRLLHMNSILEAELKIDVVDMFFDKLNSEDSEPKAGSGL